jgi:hypothetical protein
MAVLLRSGIALYLAASAFYFRDAPVTLAPELAIDASWLPPLQIALATLSLFRSTSLPAAAGIFALYAYSAYLFGMFHMLDYLFIAGIAFSMVLDSPRYNNLPKALVMLRLTVGFSLLWAAVEKWLHPEWSVAAITNVLPQLFATFDPEFVVMSAGFVEYSLAFLLAFSRGTSQYAALTLLALLLAAIPWAGWVDAIGHLPLIVILLILANTVNEATDYDLAIADAKDSFARTLLFIVSVPGLIFFYWLTDALAYDRDLDADVILFAAILPPIALCAYKIAWRIGHKSIRVLP